MKPSDAIAIVRQMQPHVSATIETHGRIELALSVLQSIALAHEAKTAAEAAAPVAPPQPAKRASKPRRRAR